VLIPPESQLVARKLEQLVAAIAGLTSDETGLEQLIELGADRPVRDRLQGRQREPLEEHRGAAQYAPGAGREQVIAPADRRLERLPAGREDPGSRARRFESGVAICPGLNDREREAASSIASGSPPSARQIFAAVREIVTSTSSLRFASVTRCRNSCTAELCATGVSGGDRVAPSGQHAGRQTYARR
jgi:hypothetical protein